ncbi:hypothetical protein MBLNU230_g7259t1 [Neophaeotheca triangularis]
MAAMATGKDDYELQNVGPSSKAFDVSPNDIDETVHRDADGVTTGNDFDAVDMLRMGRTQELRRNFNALSVLGLAMTTMSTWVAMMMTSIFSLINGGTAGTIWVYLASWIMTGFLAASLAELSSMAPTSGGQYHWVSEFAPRNQQKFLSYTVGWLAALGWQAIIATTAYTTATLTLQLIALNNPSYTPQPWQETLLMIAVALFATFFNTYGAKKLPLLEGLVLVFHVFGWFAIIIPLWVLAPKASATQVFTEFSNNGGWNSIGTACFVGTVSATASFAGSDAAVHLAEECKDASRAVPRMIMGTVLFNGAMGLVFIITFVYCITDLGAFLSSESSHPFVDVFVAGTGSVGGATAMAVIPIILSACTCLNSLAAASRQAWALSRDHGLPFSPFFRRVSTIGTPIPINSILLSLFITIILALINVGSATAFNSIIALLTGATSFSYALSIACILRKRLLGEPLPPSRFSLGRFAIPVNVIAILYVVTVAIASFFPLTIPTSAEDMNWSVVMFGGVFAIAAADYMLRGRHHYVSPVKHVHQA